MHGGNWKHRNHGPVWKNPVVPLERKLYGHPLAGLLWGKAICENPVETWQGENSQIGNVSLCIVKKDYSYLCMWMT